MDSNLSIDRATAYEFTNENNSSDLAQNLIRDLQQICDNKYSGSKKNSKYILESKEILTFLCRWKNLKKIAKET